MGRKRTLPYLILVIAIITFAALLIARNSFTGNNLPINNVKRLVTEKELVPISGKSILLTNNGIMIEGENTNLRARNMEGTVLWSIKLEGNISELLSCGMDIVVNLENKCIVTVSKSGEILWKYEMAVPAFDVLYSDKGMLLIQYKEDKYNSFEIFSTNGVRSCTAVINNTHVISFDGVLGKYYTLSLLDASSDKVLTKLITYNNKSEILWANSFENLVIPKIKYNEKGELVAITEDSIIKFKTDGKQDKSIDFANPISKVSAGDKFIVSIVKNEGYYEVIINDYNLKQLGTSAVKTKPKGVFAGNDFFLLYDDNSLTLSNRQGKISAIYESNIDINGTYIGTDSRVYVISNRKLQRLSS